MLSHNVIDNKNREWIVLIHGFGGNSLIFKKQIDDYSKCYNLLLIDVHGHGESKLKPLSSVEHPSFRLIGEDILKVMDSLSIYKAHFVGISLGTMIISAIGNIDSKRVLSLVLGGSVIKYKLSSKLLIYFGNLLRGIIPYMLLYKFFAFILMPKPNHKKSRKIFVREATKLGKDEFFTWFDLVRTFEESYPVEDLKEINVPKLFISGKEDHMFIDEVKDYVALDDNARLYVINNSGHVCNIDSPNEFNKVSLEFLSKNSLFKNIKKVV